MAKVTKKELVSNITACSMAPKKEVQIIVDSFIDSIIAELEAGNEVQIQRFGTFEVIEKKERLGRNIKTGEEIVIPAHKEPKFKFAKYVKDFIK